MFKAGIVSVAVASLRTHLEATPAVLTPLVRALELVVQNYTSVWVKEGGMSAMITALRAHVNDGDVAYPLCRMALLLARSCMSWTHPRRRKRFVDSGILAVMSQVIESCPSVAARETAGSVTFELAGGCSF